MIKYIFTYTEIRSFAVKIKLLSSCKGVHVFMQFSLHFFPATKW